MMTLLPSARDLHAEIDASPNLEASNWSGKVIWLKMMAGSESRAGGAGTEGEGPEEPESLQEDHDARERADQGNPRQEQLRAKRPAPSVSRQRRR